MATIPNTLDLAGALDATLGPIRDAVKRLTQLHTIGAVDEGNVAAARAERDQALTDVETLRRLYDTAQVDLEAERVKVRDLEAKLASYDAHPDVIAQRKALLARQRDMLQAELDRIEGK